MLNRCFEVEGGALLAMDYLTDVTDMASHIRYICYAIRCQLGLINIRPRQSNPQMEIQDPRRRAEVERIVRRMFEGK